MSIVKFLYDLPDHDVLILLSIALIAISLTVIFIIRRFVPSSILFEANPVLGSISSLIGIIYGVLAGLTALFLINNINYISDAVIREANAVENIYRDARWLPGEAPENIQKVLKNYLEEVINVEWPMMKNGEKITKKGTVLIDEIDAVLYQAHLSERADVMILNDMLVEIKALYNAREQRIHASEASLNTSLWVVIIIGTILTLAINYLFGMNFRLHVVAVSIAALMAASIIYLLITLDRPFRGDFHITPTALKEVLGNLDSGMRDFHDIKPGQMAKVD